MSVDLSPRRVELRAGDRLPALVLTPRRAADCEGGDEDFDPADYTAWTFTAVGPVTLTGVMTYDADAGTLTWAWTAGQTAAPGRYLLTVAATSGGLARTFPTVGEVELVIEPVPS